MAIEGKHIVITGFIGSTLADRNSVMFFGNLAGNTVQHASGAKHPNVS